MVKDLLIERAIQLHLFLQSIDQAMCHLNIHRPMRYCVVWRDFIQLKYTVGYYSNFQ